MEQRWVYIITGIVIGAVVTAIIIGIVSTLGSSYYYYHNGYVNSYYNLYGGYGYSIYPINKSISMSMEVPSYAHVYPQNNTIVFTSTQINLVVLAMMGNDAESMFNATPPPYVHGDVFVIYGLINPTLVVPAGAIIHVTFINLDDDMYHNFVVTTVPPPYPYYVMPYIGMYGGMGPQMMLYMRWLPPANYESGYAYGYQYVIALNAPGTYWYLCTYPGHAESGMYGEIIVTGNGDGQVIGNYQNPYAPVGYPGMRPGMMGW